MITVSIGFENGAPFIRYNDGKSNPIVRKEKGKSLIAFPEKYVCLDLETTGLSPQYDEIIEICAIKIDNDKEIERFQTLVKPENEIDEYISELTGITNELVADAPHIKDVLPSLIDFLSDWVIVGHNINFDINFIYDNCLKHLSSHFTNNYIDTMRLSRKVVPELKHHRLKDMVKYFNIDVKKEHRAAFDCAATILCLNSLKAVAIEKYGNAETAVHELTKGYKQKKHKPSDDLRKLSVTADYIDIDNPFYEKNVVFTGVLENMLRKDAAQLVVNLGGFAQNNVTKTTDFLILGNNDYCNTIKDGKSNKQKKAESLILSGSDLKIIPENVFYDMLSEWISDSEQTEYTTTENESQTKIKIHGLIPPKEAFTKFSNEQSKLDFLKDIGLIAPTVDVCKQFFYNGLYSDSLCACEIVGHIGKNTLIIQMDKHLHCINADCLAEMQPLVKEIPNYINNVPVFVAPTQNNKCNDDEMTVEEKIVDKVKELVDKRFLETTEITIKENKSDYNSLIAIPQNTIYRSGLANEKLIARIKLGKKIEYIALPGSARKTLEEYDVPFSTVKSDDFLRISIYEFLLRDDDGIKKAINDIFLNALNFPSFGCCGRYQECSEKGECIHPDILYASAACQYKKHLDNGENFYK